MFTIYCYNKEEGIEFKQFIAQTATKIMADTIKSLLNGSSETFEFIVEEPEK